MFCPFCGETETKVIDSRLVSEGSAIRRRRECTACKERFTTFETAELVMPRVIKSNGSIEPFNEDKLRSGFQKALEKRPVSIEKIDQAIIQVSTKLRAIGEREVPATQVGEFVMDALRDLDQVAYVRFASVYRQFKDINEFRDEIARLQSGVSTSKESKH